MAAAAKVALSLLLLGACELEPELPPNSSTAPRARITSEWPAYGGDPGGLRYAPLDEIRPDNVARLEVAWSYRLGDVIESGDPLGVTSFQATPILVDGVLYFPTPLNRVIALDPATGRRALALRPGPRPQRPLRVPDRAGRRGVEGLDSRARRAVSPKSLHGFPVDRVVVGSYVTDNLRTDAPSGVVRAFDTRTGALAWAFDFAPPGYDDATRPKSAAGYALGTPNVWAPMSSDPARGLLFVPTGNPAPDLYRGGDRLDMDYYGSSVVALRASTGEVVWRFQTVHHDLWDYDVASQPTLFDLARGGERLPALVQGTKMGFVFVLHRETGAALRGRGAAGAAGRRARRGALADAALPAEAAAAGSARDDARGRRGRTAPARGGGGGWPLGLPLGGRRRSRRCADRVLAAARLNARSRDARHSSTTSRARPASRPSCARGGASSTPSTGDATA
jgi:quinoprotein glucose dehydrogenase